jgi:hypothetical protein
MEDFIAARRAVAGPPVLHRAWRELLCSRTWHDAVAQGLQFFKTDHFDGRVVFKAEGISEVRYSALGSALGSSTRDLTHGLAGVVGAWAEALVAGRSGSQAEDGDGRVVTHALVACPARPRVFSIAALGMS